MITTISGAGGGKDGGGSRAPVEAPNTLRSRATAHQQPNPGKQDQGLGRPPFAVSLSQAVSGYGPLS